jgi:hypothetical protein
MYGDDSHTLVHKIHKAVSKHLARERHIIFCSDGMDPPAPKNIDHPTNPIPCPQKIRYRIHQKIRYRFRFRQEITGGTVM